MLITKTSFIPRYHNVYILLVTYSQLVIDIKQIKFDEYIAGFFDGEGTISFHCQTNLQSARIGSAIKISQSYIGAFFDAEGCVTNMIRIKKNGSCNIFPLANISQSIRTNVLDVIKEELTKLGVPSNICIVRKDFAILTITAWKDVKAFLELISPYVIVKREQVDIMLNEILPRIEPKPGIVFDAFNYKYSRKEFLEIMKWVDKLNSYKGRQMCKRKYTEQYFRDLWGM